MHIYIFVKSLHTSTSRQNTQTWYTSCTYPSINENSHANPPFSNAWHFIFQQNIPSSHFALARSALYNMYILEKEKKKKREENEGWGKWNGKGNEDENEHEQAHAEEDEHGKTNLKDG